uniref:Putative secreted peptide n=1 Tax=Anopheles braziliensis TaxID=58242 RepID=A0A2M3ZP88_9DIPT
MMPLYCFVAPFSSSWSCVFTYSVGKVMQISIPPVMPPATMPLRPLAPGAAAAAPLCSIHGRRPNGLRN